jgi:hypothetical protein
LDACCANWLTREPSDDDIDGLHGRPVNGGYITEVGDVRPVVAEDGTGVLVDFGVPDGAAADAQLEAADTGEQ